MQRNFGAKLESRTSANVGAKAKTKPYRPDPKIVDLQATVLLRPSWMDPEHEDCYLLGKLMKLFDPSRGAVHLTRAEICQKIFGRPIVSTEEDERLNRAMWELHRMGVVKLRNEEVGE